MYIITHVHVHVRAIDAKMFLTFSGRVTGGRGVVLREGGRGGGEGRGGGGEGRERGREGGGEGRERGREGGMVWYGMKWV